MVTAALFWEPSKSAINYMAVDDHYHVLISPKQVNLQSKNNFSQVKKEIESSLSLFFSELYKLNLSFSKHALVEYKTVMGSYGQARFDSLYLDKRLKVYLSKNKIPGNKVRSLLKGKELKYFKRALKSFGIRTNWHLWSIALHATQSTWETAVKHLWLAHFNEKDLRKTHNKIRFSKFLASIKADK